MVGAIFHVSHSPLRKLRPFLSIRIIRYHLVDQRINNPTPNICGRVCCRPQFRIYCQSNTMCATCNPAADFDMHLFDLHVNESSLLQPSFNVIRVPNKALLHFKNFMLISLILISSVHGTNLPDWRVFWNSAVITREVCTGFNKLCPPCPGLANAKDVFNE